MNSICLVLVLLIQMHSLYMIRDVQNTDMVHFLRNYRIMNGLRLNEKENTNGDKNFGLREWHTSNKEGSCASIGRGVVKQNLSIHFC